MEIKIVREKKGEQSLQESNERSLRSICTQFENKKARENPVPLISTIMASKLQKKFIYDGNNKAANNADGFLRSFLRKLKTKAAILLGLFAFFTCVLNSKSVVKVEKKIIKI